MGMAFSVIGIILILASLGSCAVAKTSIHEIYAAVQLLSGVALLVGGAILSELANLRSEFKAALKQSHPVYIAEAPPPTAKQ